MTVASEAARRAELRPSWPRSVSRMLVALCVVLAALAFTRTGIAKPALETGLSAATVEVGQPFELELQAVVTEGDAPSGATLSLPAGVDIMRGPSVGSRREMSFVNGSFETRKGITATWTLVAQKPGSYTLGPASVAWNGGRYDGQRVEVAVVPKGALPRRGGRRGRFGRFDDPFGLDPFDLLRKRQPDPDPRTLLPPTTPEEFLIDAAPDPQAFLRATAQPTEVVVGQQVTFRVYAYGALGPFEEVNASEASRAKFLSHVLVENSYREQRYAVDVDGTRYGAVKAREVALFPLEAGSLEIGAMRMGFRGNNYPATAAHRGLVRHSDPLTVRVVEPPVAGRPAGYRIGDVGRFTLEAAVEPRQIRQGEAVSVAITVDGVGYPPTAVRLPEQAGVEWLEPEASEQLRAKGAAVGGTRRLVYVVQIERAGAVNLGEVSLPYYDPERGRYAVARTPLGRVHVEAIAMPAPAPSASATPQGSDRVRLIDLASPREEMRPLSPPAPPHTDRWFFWMLLLGGPFGVVLVSGGARLGGAFARRRRHREASLQSQIRQALAEARAATHAGDMGRTATTIERAVYLAIEDATGVKGRGVLRSDLADVISAEGVDPAVAGDVARILDDCEALRFAPGGADASALLDRTETTTATLMRRA